MRRRLHSAQDEVARPRLPRGAVDGSIVRSMKHEAKATGAAYERGPEQSCTGLTQKNTELGGCAENSMTRWT